MKKHALIYLVILVILFGLETTPWAQAFTVGIWTEFLAKLCGGVMQIYDNQVTINGSDIINRQTGYGVSIQAGCNGIEAALILAAAILAYPSSMSSKILGAAVGITALQLLNIIRIISLYYLGSWSKKALDIAHLYVWPGLIILDALIIFLVWMYWLGKSQRSTGL